MLLLSQFYLFLYVFYTCLGYNCLHRILQNKNIDYALLDYRAYAFIGKRICMLSHIAFLYNIYFLENPNMNRYVNVLILNAIVNIGYYVKWGISEITTLIFHIYWSIPVILYGPYIINDLNFYKINKDNIFFIIFIIFY